MHFDTKDKGEDNNNNNKTVLMERLSPKSLSAIQTRYSELKNMKQKNNINMIKQLEST